MQLSKTAYYADFGVYALSIGVLTTTAAVSGDWLQRAQWLGAAAIGLAVWTLIEYALHRFVFHGMAGFSMLHGRHHTAPKAFIGTPTWVSLSVLAFGIFWPTWRAVSLNVASGLTAGVMLGFFWYGLVHHAIHHRRPRALAARIMVASHRHMRHHYSTQLGNFGVTTSLWDHVFGTALDESGAGRHTRTTRASYGAG
ncbi:MAG TPA: sterol desaturase family protein [Steroidobacteraceae bacterium]|nr:sterol desaturase family protein [Steroidobacteraceae bacterium]